MTGIGLIFVAAPHPPPTKAAAMSNSPHISVVREIEGSVRFMSHPFFAAVSRGRVVAPAPQRRYTSLAVNRGAAGWLAGLRAEGVFPGPHRSDATLPIVSADVKKLELA